MHVHSPSGKIGKAQALHSMPGQGPVFAQLKGSGFPYAFFISPLFFFKFSVIPFEGSGLTQLSE